MKRRLLLSLAIIFFLSFIVCFPAFSQPPGFPYCTDASYYCQKKVAQVPIPWQFWGVDEFGNIIDRIRISPTWLTVPPVGEGPIFVRRQFAVIQNPLPLEELVWNFDDNTPPTDDPRTGAQIQWEMVEEEPREVKIGEDLELTILAADLVSTQDVIGVLVSYEVFKDNEVVAHFMNQAVVEVFAFPPKIVTIMVNFDIHNNTDYNPTNFELDFLGMYFGKEDVLSAVGFVVGTGEPWGANPTSPLIVRPIPGGTEVKWIQHDRPLKFCEWLHIGLVINCVNFDCFNYPDDPALRATVQGYWTIIHECQKKVAQVPLPWQFWAIDEAGNIIDRIRISPTWLDPILPGQPPGEGNISVRRQVAVLPGPGQSIPLENLVWESGAASPSLDLNWRQMDEVPIPVTAEQDLELMFTQTETENAGAVLVAYEVRLESEVVGHFINEAILEQVTPGLPPKIIRILVNFDIHNNTNFEVTNFELDFHNLDFKCEDVLWAIGYVKGTGEPWGANSVNPLVVRPIPGGTEVKWVQPERPLKYCEWLHVGLMFECTANINSECLTNPDAQRVTVQGYWTIIEPPPCIFKAPITTTGQEILGAANVSRVYIGLDTQAATFPSPGPPPDYTVYSVLKGLLLEDYRQAGSDNEEWKMIVQVGDMADPDQQGFYPEISWNPSDLCPPEPGKPHLSLWHESLDGTRKLLIWDMQQTTQYQTKSEEFSFIPGQDIWVANYIFVWSSEISVEMHMPVGWSMVSLPVVPGSSLVSDLFPDAVVVYGYEKASGYVRVSKMEAGKGYWILFYTPKSYTITGQPFNEYSTTVTLSGWEMIGGCTFPAKPTTDSCDIIVTYKYIPEVGYQRVYATEHLMPSVGYWILLNNVLTQCTLTVQVAP